MAGKTCCCIFAAILAAHHLSPFPAAAFSWEPEVAQTPPGSVTFTRATTAQVLTTTDGTTNWYQEALSGEIHYEGLRRVENVLPDADPADAAFTSDVLGSASLTLTSNFTTGVANDGNTALRMQASVSAGGTTALRRRDTSSLQNKPSTSSVWVRSNTGANQTILFQARVGVLSTITVTPSWQRFSVHSSAASAADARWGIGLVFGTTDSTMDILVDVDKTNLYIPQKELVQSTNTQPSDTVDPDVTYNANVAGVQYFNTTNGNSVDGNGVVTEAAGTTITGGGYLPEPAVTNQLANVDPTDGIWSKPNLTITDNGINDLGLNEYELDAGTNTAGHIFFGASSSGGAGCGYVIAKEGTGRFLTLKRGVDNGSDYACFDLQTGTATEDGAGIDSSFVVDLGNDWYLCGVITSDTSTTFGVGISDSSTPGNFSPSFTGANETVLICHIQYENNDFSTSPIVTSGATVTRNADVLTSSATWASSNSGFADVTLPSVLTGADVIMGASDGSRFFIETPQAIVYLNGVGGFAKITTSSAVVVSTRSKFAFRAASNDFRVVDDEGGSATDSSGSVHTGTLTVGMRSTNTQQFRGRIHKLSTYDVALTNDQLDTLVA